MQQQDLPSQNAPKRKRKRTDTNSSAEPTTTSNKRHRLNSSLCLSSDGETKILDTIDARYDVQLQSVISSSKIRLRVTSVLRHLTPSTQPPSIEPADDTTTDITTSKPRLAILRAKATEANKMISIAEIAKREIEKEQLEPASDGLKGKSSRVSGRGRWFQYIALGEELQQRSRTDDHAIGEPNASREDDDEDDDFEVMKTPFERALEGRPLVRGIPVMSLFLARSPIPELKKQYGEQTNAPPT